MTTKQHPVYIQDPIHGPIVLSEKELGLSRHSAFQRLRYIKQLGFADLAFPGATHTRYSHSLGAMQVATRMFDHIFSFLELPHWLLSRFRQHVRLSVLFHDIGHAPLSHTTEKFMPPLSALKLKPNTQPADCSRLATHEDYTLKILTDSSFSKQIESVFDAEGISLLSIAELLFEHIQTESFVHQGINYATLLRQIVSSECDADRMDYLQRDSFYCGVPYGKFDGEWLLHNLMPLEKDGAMHMSIRARATFGFEDFLLSRYHMFASVYLHHTCVIFEKMLACFFEENEETLFSESDIERYMQMDDIDMWQLLRQSPSEWAKRIVQRRPFYLLQEVRLDLQSAYDLQTGQEMLAEKLRLCGISFIQTKSQNPLSKYIGLHEPPIYVVTHEGQAVSLESSTPLYKRYQVPAQFYRTYVAPEYKQQAQAILAKLLHEPNFLCPSQ